MTRPTIFLTRRWPEPVERNLSERYDTILNESDRPLEIPELQEAVRSCDALCPTVSDRITAEVLEVAGRKTRIVGNYGAGVSHIDLDTCRRLGLVVTNTPDVLSEATAELAVTLMLMSARRASEGEREVRSGKWAGWRPMHHLGAQLTGKTLGLIGFGRIAQATARKARFGFGMEILYYSRRRAPLEAEAESEASYCASMDQLLERSDFVSLHCPGGAATRHLINAQSLAKMKRTAFLINTARGEVVDEVALSDALSRGVIAGAGLDVYEQEPAIAPSLLKAENAVLLPHLGSATAETRIAMGMRVAENLERFFSGQPLRDPVA